MEESGVVHLNVGGTPFDTTVQTLTKHPESMLGTMFAERNRDTLKTGKDGRIFLDRDPVCFGVLLEFLRCGELYVPTDVYPSKMRAELYYWGFDADELRKKVRCENVGMELSETSENYLRETLGAFAEDLVAYHRDEWRRAASRGTTEVEVAMVHLNEYKDSVRFLWMEYDRCRNEAFRLLFPPNGLHPTLRPDPSWNFFDAGALFRRIYKKLQAGKVDTLEGISYQLFKFEQLKHVDWREGSKDECLSALKDLCDEDYRHQRPADGVSKHEFFLLLKVCDSKFFVPECHDCAESFSERLRKIEDLMRDKSKLFSMQRPREVFAEILEERMGFSCSWRLNKKYDIDSHGDDYRITEAFSVDGTVEEKLSVQKDVWSLGLSWAPKETVETSDGPKNKKRKKM